MPTYARGDRIIFTGELSAELYGIAGIVLRRRISNGHYVYDIQISAHLPSNIPFLNLSAKGVASGVASAWFELLR